MPWEWKGIRAFLQQKNWLLSAGLIMAIYLLLAMTIGFYVDTTEHRSILLIHLMPVLAAAVFLWGYRQKLDRDEREQERRKMRYRAKLEIDKLRAADAGPPPPPQSPAAGEGGKDHEG